jgi:hypothetical protein
MIVSRRLMSAVWRRASSFQPRQLDRWSAHDRGVGREHDAVAVLKAAFSTDSTECDGRRGDPETAF